MLRPQSSIYSKIVLSFNTTCSLFLEENEEQVDSFLKTHKNFRLVSANEVLGNNENLSSCINNCGYLRMSPAQNKTDGVFAAIFEKF